MKIFLLEQFLRILKFGWEVLTKSVSGNIIITERGSSRQLRLAGQIQHLLQKGSIRDDNQNSNSVFYCIRFLDYRSDRYDNHDEQGRINGWISHLFFS